MTIEPETIAPSQDLVIDLGRENYEPVLLLQRHLNYLCNEDLISSALIFVEHEDAYTVGIHRNPQEILSNDIRPVEVERGGSATYHGPGQIVAYFIVNLKNLNINIRDLITRVENSVSEVLKSEGIDAEGRLHGETGIWVENRKICSIGFAIKGFSTLHGIALNITTDLSKFDGIMPCGMDSAIMTSVERELGRKVDYLSIRSQIKEEILSDMNIKKYLEINSLKKLKEYSVSNGLGLLPEELLKVVV